MPHLEIADLSASYEKGVDVLSGIDLQVERGEILSLIGPSGSGKSTLLRVIVGLLPPDSGRMEVDGAPVNFHDKRSLRELRGRCAIVFQQYNLFQNMNVMRNVTIAPTKIKKRDAASVRAEAEALLEKVGLGDKHDAYPDELSGGQQQRVAIARALALKPEILLLDEVTSALDPELVNEVLDAVRVLAREGMTMVVVSHEMGFVREVSTRVAMMDEGRIVETGTPEEIFDRPSAGRTRDFVAKILRG